MPLHHVRSMQVECSIRERERETESIAHPARPLESDVLRRPREAAREAKRLPGNSQSFKLIKLNLQPHTKPTCPRGGFTTPFPKGGPIAANEPDRGSASRSPGGACHDRTPNLSAGTRERITDVARCPVLASPVWLQTAGKRLRVSRLLPFKSRMEPCEPLCVGPVCAVQTEENDQESAPRRLAIAGSVSNSAGLRRRRGEHAHRRVAVVAASLFLYVCIYIYIYIYVSIHLHIYIYI